MKAILLALPSKYYGKRNTNIVSVYDGSVRNKTVYQTQRLFRELRKRKERAIQECVSNDQSPVDKSS